MRLSILPVVDQSGEPRVWLATEKDYLDLTITQAKDMIGGIESAINAARQRATRINNQQSQGELSSGEQPATSPPGVDHRDGAGSFPEGD